MYSLPPLSSPTVTPVRGYRLLGSRGRPSRGEGVGCGVRVRQPFFDWSVTVRLPVTAVAPVGTVVVPPVTCRVMGDPARTVCFLPLYVPRPLLVVEEAGWGSR